MKKKILPLLLALVMVLSISTPLAAGTYDVQYTGIPQTQFRVVEIWHQVTRGESMLEGVPTSIPDLWGVPASQIVSLNSSYFADLAARSTTMHSDPTELKAEPGVWLLIGYRVTARQYVFRGLTLDVISDNFGIPVPDIMAENAGWFAELGLINTTTGWDSPLVESFSILGIFPYIDVTLAPMPSGNPQPDPAAGATARTGRNAALFDDPTFNWVLRTHVGTPLHISWNEATMVPGTTPANFFRMFYFATPVEFASPFTTVPAYQQTTNMPTPTNVDTPFGFNPVGLDAGVGNLVPVGVEMFDLPPTIFFPAY